MWTLQDIGVDEIETHASIVASEAMKVYADMSIMKVLINLCRIAMFYEKDYPNRSEALNIAIDLLGDEYTVAVIGRNLNELPTNKVTTTQLPVLERSDVL